jgi:hypothetical protein
MLLEAETNKYCPGGNDFGAISNLITWVLNFFLSVGINSSLLGLQFLSGSLPSFSVLQNTNHEYTQFFLFRS